MLGEIIIAVDFDGTLCANAYPDIGKPYVEVISKLRDIRELGVKLILWTCREGQDLAKALEWCVSHGLYFDALNEDYIMRDGRKIYAHLYLDDKAVTPKEFMEW